MIPRRRSRKIDIGGVDIGGDAPVRVQSMTKTITADVEATVQEILGLEDAGCELVRVAVPDMEAAKAIPEIKRRIHIPLIADIHFHHQLAIEALKGGVDGLRLNPGNIRDPEKVREVVRLARERQVPIRIGVNFGSLPPVGRIGVGYGVLPPVSRLQDGVNKLAKGGEPPGQPSVVEHMVQTALWEVRVLEDLGFDLIKLSLKAFDVPTTVEAYRRIAGLVPYPLHLGITESGTVKSGTVRSAVGLGVLLAEGIGDTIRVSLAGDPREEVYVGFEILKSLNLREKGPTMVACPSCGRADVDIRKLADQVDELLRKMGKKVKVAVMGCEVNGPGEAKDADVGLAAGRGRAVIFRKGQKVRVVDEKDMFQALIEEVEKV